MVQRVTDQRMSDRNLLQPRQVLRQIGQVVEVEVVSGIDSKSDFQCRICGCYIGCDG